MSVFLRWGVFGILAVAAMIYAYNANKRLAERHSSRAPVVATAGGEAEQGEDEAEGGADTAAEPVPAPPPIPLAAHCEAELFIAEQALDYRREGEPLDRLMRIQEIAFQQDPVRRQRLETVARRWYKMDTEPSAARLRSQISEECR